MAAIITQNIDGLHQASGVPEERIVELHGNGTYAACLSCGHRMELATVRAELATGTGAPLCRACGGIVKSATISFGQSMPKEPMRRARALSEAADLFVVAGSSLVVHPAATFPVIARQRGARLAIINREPTGLDSIADLVVRGDIGPVFAHIDRIMM
jgi:NAD-dependent deacetylase